MYDMVEQLATGDKGATVLDRHFSQGYKIKQATHEEDRRGIDRWFVGGDGIPIPVQYKADYMSQLTGNLIVELISVDSDNVPGWAITCTAEWIAWLRWDYQEVINIRTSSIRDNLPQWYWQYPLKPIPNKGYFTHGLAVPIQDIKDVATTVQQISESCYEGFLDANT